MDDCRRSMIRHVGPCVAVGVYLVSAFAASAHDTWITPSAFASAAGKEVRFETTSGMKFPTLETGPKADRIAKAGFRLGGETGELKDFVASKEALRVYSLVRWKWGSDRLAPIAAKAT